MSHFPYPVHAPLFINSFSGRFTPSIGMVALGAPFTSGGASTWPAANRALYCPLVLPYAYPVKRVFWCNGGVAGTIDLGIYDAASGTRLYSTGTTTQTGANVNQYVSVDLLLQPGEYYLGLVASSGSSSHIRTVGIAVNTMRHFGWLQEASASPLPSTMTGAAIAAAYLPLFGFTRTASGY